MPYIDVTPEQGRQFFTQPDDGPIVMLNLLRFRDVADYSKDPNLAPPAPISGAAAYLAYKAAVAPLLESAGSELIFAGSAGPFLIGPEESHWDEVLLVRHKSRPAFLGFAQNPAYLAIKGHRTAALSDSRLLPVKASI